MRDVMADAKAIFLEALDCQGADELRRLLERACGADDALRGRVEELLRAHRDAGAFLGGAEKQGATCDQPVAERPGTLIGSYKLLQQLGEGGMGVVWMAEQTQPVQRKVALKLIKSGMDSRQVIARFEAERQALALMDHINIARVLDAGAAEAGRPYFVMELVHGVPITKYCDDNRLTPRQRLELFVPVCQAVQHAHQKGIIHRDLKPSNVLVTLYDGKPVPKVIDFGVAKATEQKLTERTLFTQYGTLVGTLEYMSPEQAEMSALGVDTRSDIYSLGVLLYELLTGSTPLGHQRVKEAAYAEILRRIKEEEPPRPSARLSDSGAALASISAQRHMEPAKLTKLVRGELDWIVMKSLEKDRSRRYETADGFALDVQHYLADEPVLACPPSAWYRFQKFARRTGALGVVAVLLLAAGLLAGTVFWAWRDRAGRQAEAELRQALTEQDARRELGQAQAQRADLQAHLRRPGGTFELLNNQSEWRGRIKLVEATLRRAEALAARAGVQHELSAGLQQVTDSLKHDQDDLEFALALEQVQRNKSVMVRGDFDFAGAAPQYLSVFQKADFDILHGDPGELVKRIQESAIKEALVAALDDWAMATLYERADLAKREQTILRLLDVARRADRDPWRDQLRDPLLWDRPQAFQEVVALAPMPRLSPQMLTVVGAMLNGRKLDHASWLRQAQLLNPEDFWINLTLGNALKDKDPGEAVGFYRAALAARKGESTVYSNLGHALQLQGKYVEAEAACRKAIELKKDYAAPYTNLGVALLQQNRLAEAEAVFRQALQLEETVLDRFDLALVLAQQKKSVEAVAEFDRVIQCMPGAGPTGREGLDIARVHYLRGRALHDANNLSEAEKAYREACRLKPDDAQFYNQLGCVLREQNKLPQAAAAFHQAIKLKWDYAQAYFNLGQTYQQLKKPAQAEAAYRKAVELKANDAEAYLNLGTVMHGQNKFAAAEAAFRKAIELKPDFAMAHYNLGIALHRQNKLADAAAAHRQAIKLKPDFPQAYTNLGIALLDLKRLEDAVLALRTAIKLKQDDAQAHYNLGVALVTQGKQAEAEKAFRQAFDLQPDDVHACYNLGNVLRQQKKLAEAVTAYRKALELKEDFAEAHCNLGHTLRMEGHLAEALKHLREGHRLGSQRPDWGYPSASWVRQCEQLLQEQHKFKGKDPE